MNDLSMYVSNVTEFDDMVALFQAETDRMSVWWARHRLPIDISKSISILIARHHGIKDYGV